MKIYFSSCTVLLISLLFTTIVLVACSILVMAEEFKGLPNYLQHSSAMLVHNKQHRTIFICSVISLMALTSVISVLACPTGRSYPETLIYDGILSPRTDVSIERNQDAVTTSSAGLDRLILSFIEEALSDEAARESKSIDQPIAKNRTVSHESSNIEVKLTHVVDRNDLARTLSRREFFRFYRYEKHYGARRHHRRFARKREAGLRSRKALSIVDDLSTTNSTDSLLIEEDAHDRSCLRPEYIVFTWILCLIALASALKLYYLVKTGLATIIVMMYAILILVGCKNLFLNDIGYDNV